MDERLKIMIIDDESIVGIRLKSSLEKIGYRVEAFTDSKEAMKILAKRNFDIIVTDLKMPAIDGMEIFQFAKNHWPDTKVIMISGYATVETAKDALKEGVYDFIVKPFRISQLREIIKKAATELPS